MTGKNGRGGAATRRHGDRGVRENGSLSAFSSRNPEVLKESAVTLFLPPRRRVALSPRLFFLPLCF